MNRKRFHPTAKWFFAILLALTMAFQAVAQTPQPSPVQQPEDPEVAKARETLRQAEAAAALRQAEQKAWEEKEKKLFDIPRLLTVWDYIERDLTSAQMSVLDAEEESLRTPQDVIDLFTKYYPSAFGTKADPKYVDPSTLVPARDSNSAQFSKFQEFKQWRTHPVGPTVKDLADLRVHQADVLSDIDNTPLEQAFPKDQADKIRDAWKRRMALALAHKWPWALGIAKIDVLSQVHKIGNYKKDGKYHVEVGILNRLQGKDATQPVLFLWLPEVSQISELAFECRNGFIAELEVAYKFRAEVVEPTCDSVKGEPMKFTSDLQKGNYTAAMKQNDLEIRNHKWSLGEEVVSTQQSTSVIILGGQLAGLPASNKLVFSAEAREKGQPEDGKWFPVSCSISLTKELPPQPPPVVAPPPVIVTPPPPPPPPAELCAECKAAVVGDKKLKGKDTQSQVLYLHAEMVGLPEGVKPTILEWRATWPGDKTPTVIAEGTDGEVSPSQFPHNAKTGKLVPGPYLATFVFEYQKKDGTMCRRACSVTIQVDKDGWDKRWLLLLAPLGLLGLLKHKTCPTCGKCPTCSGGPGATPNPIP